jgi:IclR family transcriptional regulator, acetate operon repressor
VRDGRRYSGGPGLARLQTSSAGFTLADRAAPLVRTLRVQLDETTSFFIRDGWEIEAIVTESSEQALRYSVPQGRRLPMHALAAGKVLLASLPPEELDRYFAETERRHFAEATITDEKPLRKQLEEARRTGFAMTDEEYSLGIVGIARLVTIGGEAVGSLSVAVPKVRFDDDLHARVADLLDRTADLLEGS